MESNLSILFNKKVLFYYTFQPIFSSRSVHMKSVFHSTSEIPMMIGDWWCHPWAIPVTQSDSSPNGPSISPLPPPSPPQRAICQRELPFSRRPFSRHVSRFQRTNHPRFLNRRRLLPAAWIPSLRPRLRRLRNRLPLSLRRYRAASPHLSTVFTH